MTKQYTTDEMEATLAGLKIVPQKLPILTARGLAWRQSKSDDQWKAWLREHDYTHNRESMLAALKKEGYITIRPNLIDGHEFATIENDRAQEMYPDEELSPYTIESVVWQVAQRVITPYRVMNPITGRPRTHKHYYDYRDAFEIRLSPRHVGGSVRGWQRRVERLATAGGAPGRRGDEETGEVVAGMT